LSSVSFFRALYEKKEVKKGLEKKKEVYKGYF